MPPRRRRRRSPPTPAQIWRILRATNREARIAKREYAEMMRRIAREEQERKREAAERKREAAERKRNYEEEEKARKREYEAAERASAQRLAELQEQSRQADEARRKEQAERDRKLDEKLDRIAGDGDQRRGRLMEALVRGDLPRVLRGAGIEVIHVYSGVRSQMYEEMREYDLVAVGASDAVVVEAKTTLRASDVRTFTQRIRDFREWRPDHARPRIRGALACLTAEGKATRRAESAGFYLIRAVGGSARIMNSEGFAARIF